VTVVRKDVEKATLLYEEVLKIDPKHCMALGNLAMLKHQIGQFEESYTLYEKSISLYPNHATVLASFANLIKIWKKDYVRSKQFFEKAIHASSQDDTELLGNYAVLLHGCIRDYDAAEKAYERSIKALGGTDNANALGNYALFLCDVRRDFKKAERTYEQAVRADPSHSNSLYNYGVFLETIRDDTKRAAEFYDRAVRSNDQHVLARQALAGLLESTNPNRAERLYKDALKLVQDNDAPLLADFGTFLSKQGGENNIKRAIKMMTRSIELDGSQQNLMYNLAYLQKKISRWDLAVETLQRLLLINPKHATALGLLANIRASPQGGAALQNLTEARHLYERALEVAPNDATNRKNYEIFLLENVDDC